ncbi:MAG: hypothetical protein FI716_02750 [SAR202 cluster bacterium]|nr:hypothetical protein [SAR202 cluster bacterium]
MPDAPHDTPMGVSRDKGEFTLIELPVLVGIIVVLAAVVVPQVVRFSDRGGQVPSGAEWDAIQGLSRP